MKLSFVSIAILTATVCNANVGFVKYKDSTSIIMNPLLAENGTGVGDVINFYNFDDSTIGVPRMDVEILSPGLEESWYMGFNIGSLSSSAGSLSGEQRVTSVLGLPKMNGHQKLHFYMDVFSAVNWSDYCSDYATYPSIECTDSAGKAIKNTAKEIDTLNARLIVYWFNWDNPKWDGYSPILQDSTFLPFRVQYVRGPTARDLTLGLNRRARNRQGVRFTPHGWQVPTGGRWTLRNLQGREIPLRQESTNDGVMLLPQGLHGVGVLTGPNGQSSKVHSLGGN